MQVFKWSWKERDMLYFANDYTEGACKEILDAFIRTNDEKLPGYGTDKYTLSAEEKIKKACKKWKCRRVSFNRRNTDKCSCNRCSALNPMKELFSPETGHINVHESGAIEFTGHKVLTLPQHEGK